MKNELSLGMENKVLSSVTFLGAVWKRSWRIIVLFVTVFAGISPGAWLNLVSGLLSLLNLAPGLNGKPMGVLPKVLSWLLLLLSGVFLRDLISDEMRRKEKRLRASPDLVELLATLARLLRWDMADSMGQIFSRITREWSSLEPDKNKHIQLPEQLLVTSGDWFHRFQEHLQQECRIRDAVPELASIIGTTESVCKTFNRELLDKRVATKRWSNAERLAFRDLLQRRNRCVMLFNSFLVGKLGYTTEQAKQLLLKSTALVHEVS